MLGLAAAAAAARLALLLSRPLWFDELFTVWAARLPFRDLIEALRFDSGPPGFYLLEKPFVALAESFGDGDRLVRVLPFLATLLLFLAARGQPRGEARSFLVLLFSASVLLNLYAAEARPYALLALLGLVLFRLALSGTEHPRRLILLALAGAVALYLHYLALLAVGALILLAAFERRWRSCAALGASVLAFAPWIPVLLAQPAASVAWAREPARSSVVGFLSALGGVGRVPTPFGPPPARALYLAGVAAGAWLLVVLLLRAREDRDIRASVAYALLVLGGALAAGAWRPIAFAGRTEMVVLPVWLWGAARAVSASRGARAASGVVAALGVLATLGFLLVPHEPTPPAEVAANLARVAGPNDLVVAGAGFYLPARLASEQGRLAGEVRALPGELARHPGWFVPSLPGAEEEQLVARAMADVPPGGRLFLALPPDYATPGLRAVLGSPGGRARELLRSEDTLVILWTPAPAAAAVPVP